MKTICQTAKPNTYLQNIINAYSNTLLYGDSKIYCTCSMRFFFWPPTLSRTIMHNLLLSTSLANDSTCLLFVAIHPCRVAADR